MSMHLVSQAFASGDNIPPMYTCDGENISPPLSWFDVPPETKSLALIVDDPDAPDPAAPRKTWVHWVLYNIPPGVHDLRAGIGSQDLPAGTKQGVNDWDRFGYGGPCPPIGCHRYFYNLYALDTVLPDLGATNKPSLLNAIRGHILEQTQLLGLYQR